MAEDEGDDGSESKPNREGSDWTLTRLVPANCLTNFHRDLVAGALMGGVVHTIVAPIERAKLLLQTQESNLAIVTEPHRRFKGMLDCIVRTVREEGILSLWRGNGSSVIRYYPSVALNFSLKVKTYSCTPFFFFFFFTFLFSFFCTWTNVCMREFGSKIAFLESHWFKCSFHDFKFEILNSLIVYGFGGGTILVQIFGFFFSCFIFSFIFYVHMLICVNLVLDLHFLIFLKYCIRRFKL